jgi:hypothetical protein
MLPLVNVLGLFSFLKYSALFLFFFESDCKLGYLCLSAQKINIPFHVLESFPRSKYSAFFLSSSKSYETREMYVSVSEAPQY